MGRLKKITGPKRKPKEVPGGGTSSKDTMLPNATHPTTSVSSISGEPDGDLLGFPQGSLRIFFTHIPQVMPLPDYGATHICQLYSWRKSEQSSIMAAGSGRGSGYSRGGLYWSHPFLCLIYSFPSFPTQKCPLPSFEIHSHHPISVPALLSTLHVCTSGRQAGCNSMPFLLLLLLK